MCSTLRSKDVEAFEVSLNVIFIKLEVFKWSIG